MPRVGGYIKSGLIAAFFLLMPLSEAGGATLPESNYPTIVARLKDAAIAERLDQLPIWSSLLHADNGGSEISDSNFLLSLPKFSLAQELQLTIDFLYQGAGNNVCRFPARYFWLRQQLNAPALPLEACPDIVEFRRRAPLDTLSLVFASETVSQPASMLGHAFLKFSGKNEQGDEVSHAISFYTDAETYNLPKLLFDSLVVGKSGYFSLSPYHEKQQRYVDLEQRNLWEYQLALDAFQKELIQLHIIELKQTRLTYFFQKYNCATVLNFILSLSGARLQGNGRWVTPKDVIKNIQQAGLLAETRVVTPSRWLYRLLADQLTTKERKQIHWQIQHRDIESYLSGAGSDSDFIRTEFAKVYNQYAYLSKELDKDTWLSNEHSLAAIETRQFPDKFLNIDDRYNPVNTPGDAQVSYAIQFDRGEPAFTLTALPISHTLSDDNRNYQNETSLQLFAIGLKLPLRQARAELAHLTIFDMQSLVPYDEITGGISGRVHIAVEPQKDARLAERRAFTANAGIGLTGRLVQGCDIYLLGGGGVGYASAQGYFFSTLEAGMVLREAWDMKTLLSIMRTDNQINSGSYYYTVGLNQSKFLSKASTLGLVLSRDFNGAEARNSASLVLKRIF